MIHKTRYIFLLPALLALLGACTPTVANRGQMIDPEKIASVKVGLSTREDVAMILGSPTQVSTFNENTWYYFGRTTKQYSFLTPEVVEQKAVVVSFNDGGTVTDIHEQDPQMAKVVEPVSRRTPTHGRETTVIEQVVGNLGRPAARGRK